MPVINVKTVRIFYLLFVVFWAISDSSTSYRLFERAKAIEYIFMAGSIFAGLIIILVNYDKCRPNFYVLGQIAVFVLAALSISLLALPFNGFSFNGSKDLFSICFPALLSFVICTLDSESDKDFYFNALFLSLVVIFLVRSRYIPINAIFTISFSKSYSPYENAGESGTLALCFIYYMLRKKHFPMFVAGILAILTFKRIQVLFIIAMFLMYVIGKDRFRSMKVSNTLLNLMKVALIVSPVIISLVISPAFTTWYDMNHERSFDQFTMGRVWQLTELAKLDDIKLGLGRVNQLLENYNFAVTPLHSDLYRYYLELTPVGLFFFVNSYINTLKESRSFILFCSMGMLLLIMFASSCIFGLKLWTAMFLLLQSDPATEKEPRTAFSAIRDSTSITT